MIRDALFRQMRFMAVTGLATSLPLSSAMAGGWWNHRSVVAVPTGGPVGTVTGAAPYQIFTAPAAAPVAQSPVYSYAAPAYSAPAYSAPATAYGVWVPMQAAAPQQAPAFGAAAPQQGNSNDDLVRELANRLKSAAPAAAAPAAQSPAASAAAANLSTEELLRELGRRQQAAAYSAAPANSAAPAYSAPAQPVIIGYSYAAPAPAAVPQATVAPQAAGTMSLVPVQLYKQKSFLGIDKLKPVSVYPYGVR